MNGRKSLTVALSALLLSTSVAGATFAAKEDREGIEITFKDTSNMNWVKDSIGRMKSKEIFQGHKDGLFKPYESVTRIQSIITVVRLLGLEEEALRKTGITELPFKDVSSINPKYYGYLTVALETGILTANDEVFSAYKPASRVWISELLVRALGLIEEAEKAAFQVPEFKDANEIAQEEVGFVNIASDYEIFSGTLEGFFNPHHDITRAQMAAVLDRTYGSLLEEEGAVTVNGTVKAIEFSANTGTVVVSNFNGEETAYQISKDLLVQYQTRFLTADQIRIGDVVELYVENGMVVEAAIYPENTENTVQLGVQEIKVEAELADGTDFELAYSNKKGKEKGKIEIENEQGELEYRDSEALSFISDYLGQWNLTPELSEAEAEALIVTAFTQEVLELEFKVKFSNGNKLQFEREELDTDEDIEAENERDEDEQDKNEGPDAEFERDEDESLDVQDQQDENENLDAEFEQDENKVLGA